MNPTKKSYEPPISKGEMPTKAWQPTMQLAPGVRGYTFRKGKLIIIPLILAEKEGSGDVGRFLDRLSANCVIMSVTSERLAGMLERRGYQKFFLEETDFWARL
jgi:hypothetical protein